MSINIKTIGVCGAGTMGAGIAQLALQAGYTVILFDVNPDMLKKAEGSIRQQITRQSEKKKISPEAVDAMMNELACTTNATGCKADLVIEAILENLEAKVSLFTQLAAINSPDTILATNTSSLSVTVLAGSVPVASRVAGMHFFNPAPVMKLVEIISTPSTHEEVIAALMMVARKLDKTPVLCKDAAGFIVNRIARHYYLEALHLAEQGVAIETIDTVLEATGFKMGPFRLMDLIGNDVNLAVTKSIYEASGKPLRFKPSKLQEEKVRNGELGRKSGKGYYPYS